MEWYHVCWPRLTTKRVEPVVSISWASCCYYAPRIVWGHYSLTAAVCLSVCLSCVKSRTEESRKLKIGRKEAHDKGDPWPHLEVKRSRSPGRLTPWQKISHIFGTGRPTNFKLGYTGGARWPASPTCAVTANVKAQVTTRRQWLKWGGEGGSAPAPIWAPSNSVNSMSPPDWIYKV